MLHPSEVEDWKLPAALEQLCGADIAKFGESHTEQIETAMCDFASTADFSHALAAELTDRLARGPLADDGIAYTKNAGWSTVSVPAGPLKVTQQRDGTTTVTVPGPFGPVVRTGRDLADALSRVRGGSSSEVRVS